MNARALLLLLALAAPVAAVPIAAAQTVAETHEANRLFALATELYEAGDYAAAAATYASILDLGWTDGGLHHNLGMAYLGADDLGRAILHLEQADRLLPDDPAIVQHLADARARVKADQTAVSASPLAVTALRIADVLTLGGLLALALLLWFGAVGGLAYLFRRASTLSAARVTALRRGILVALPLSLLLFATALVASGERSAPRAVVLDATPLAATPGGSATEPPVAQGVTVRLRNVSPRAGWEAVRLPDGTEGWLPTAVLGRL